jgi:ribosomal protein S18 acetylase RimI-like enzyme
MSELRIISLKDLNSKDMASLCAVCRRAFPNSPWSKKYFFSFIANKKRKPLGYVVKVKNKIIGFVLGRAEKSKPAFLNLSSLWVDRKKRGKKMGRRLVKKFIRTASRREGVKIIRLHFRASNNLGKFYSAVGFRIKNNLEKYSNGEEKVCMELKLK